ncbi:TPA: hypothetical protein JG871_004248 [Enterobacter hormaechei subsp. xiangfangensis]|nr:hypothetical protein [Enterobacter hormaechei subsp. xiangfangensis]
MTIKDDHQQAALRNRESIERYERQLVENRNNPPAKRTPEQVKADRKARESAAMRKKRREQGAARLGISVEQYSAMLDIGLRPRLSHTRRVWSGSKMVTAKHRKSTEPRAKDDDE